MFQRRRSRIQLHRELVNFAGFGEIRLVSEVRRAVAPECRYWIMSVELVARRAAVDTEFRGRQRAVVVGVVGSVLDIGQWSL